MADSTPNPFPDHSHVLVWYPLDANDADRTTWAWLPGTIMFRCGPDEWCVDPNPPFGDVPENDLYPACFRDAGELRPVSAREWDEARNGVRP
jgi:hypothetical protein